MDFDDFKWPKSESFHFTDEMLDDCDISESVTLESISMPTVSSSSAMSNAVQSTSVPEVLAQQMKPTKQFEPEHCKATKNVMIESSGKSQNTMGDDAETTTVTDSSTDNRCKDEIFGEFVVATLKKLPLDEKKRIKKQIMEILLDM